MPLTGPERDHFRNETLPTVLRRIVISHDLREQRQEIAREWFVRLMPKCRELLQRGKTSGVDQLARLTTMANLVLEDGEIIASFQLRGGDSSISLSCVLDGRNLSLFTFDLSRQSLLDNDSQPVNWHGGNFARQLLDLLETELAGG